MRVLSRRDWGMACVGVLAAALPGCHFKQDTSAAERHSKGLYVAGQFAGGPAMALSTK